VTLKTGSSNCEASSPLQCCCCAAAKELQFARREARDTQRQDAGDDVDDGGVALR
jgi:hypothetical protein